MKHFIPFSVEDFLILQKKTGFFWAHLVRIYKGKNTLQSFTSRRWGHNTFRIWHLFNQGGAGVNFGGEGGFLPKKTPSASHKILVDSYNFI